MRVTLDLAPDPADQDVDAAFEGAGAAPLRDVDQLVTRQGPARAFAQRLQQIELGAGQSDEASLWIGQAPRHAIEPPVVDRHEPRTRLAGRDRRERGPT